MAKFVILSQISLHKGIYIRIVSIDEKGKYSIVCF